MEAKESAETAPEEKPKKPRHPRQQAWLDRQRARTGFEDRWFIRQAKTNRKLTLHKPAGVIEGKLQHSGFFRIHIKTQSGEIEEVPKLDLLCLGTKTNYNLVRLAFEVDEELQAKKLIPEQDYTKRYQVPDALIEQALEKTNLQFTLLDGTRFTAMPVTVSFYSIYVLTPGDNGRHFIVFKHGLHEIRALEPSEPLEKDQG